jgi:hypothetical protein
MECKICNSRMKAVFRCAVLDKYDITNYYCNNCGFLCTEDPYWLKEAYVDSIGDTDTGILQRNIYLSKITTVLIYFFLHKKSKFIDYAGGYGIFTRLMRDIGFDFYWTDPYTSNLFAKGFEYRSEEGGFELLTTFETLEHFPDPLKEIERFLKLSKNILITTELLPDGPPRPNQWWYYNFRAGQHISFYSKKTFEFIAKNYLMNFYTDNRNIHFLTPRKINPYFFLSLLKLTDWGLYFLISKQLKRKMKEDMGHINA